MLIQVEVVLVLLACSHEAKTMITSMNVRADCRLLHTWSTSQQKSIKSGTQISLKKFALL